MDTLDDDSGSTVFDDDLPGHRYPWEEQAASVAAHMLPADYPELVDYDYSRPLDVWRHSEHRPTLRIIREVLEAIGLGTRRRSDSSNGNPALSPSPRGSPTSPRRVRASDSRKYRDHVRRVLLDLALSRYAPDGRLLAVPLWLGVSLRQGDFVGTSSRYNRIHFAYRPLVAALTLLKDHGLILVAKGFLDRERGIGRVTRIRCTAKLYRLLSGISSATVTDDPEFELVRLQETAEEHGPYKRKVRVEYTDDEYPETVEMRRFLVEVNDKLKRTHVALSDSMTAEHWRYLRGKLPHLNFHSQRIYRVFNGDMNLGGRFYGPFWQRLPGKDRFEVDEETRERKQVKWGIRSFLRIDGQETVEVDYAAIHGVLTYHYAGKLGELRADPYTVEGYDRFRDGMKLIFQILVNNDSVKAAKAACRAHDKLGKGCVHLVDVLLEHHAPVREHLLRNSGTMLQRADAKLAEHVMRFFWDRDIPVLPIHDSFVIAKDYRAMLEGVMLGELDSHGIDWRVLPFKAVK